MKRACVALWPFLPLQVQAHSFGVVYNLPVPFWLYAWAAAAALLGSFLIAVWVLRSADTSGWWARSLRFVLPGGSVSRIALTLARGLLIVLLLLAILSGLMGTANPYANLNMTLFWVWLLLAGAYASALLGDWYYGLNPWRSLACILRVGQGTRFWTGLDPEARMQSWPAVIAYLALLWLELFGGTDPARLSWVLIGYSCWNLAGAWLLGAHYWFRRAELFAVLFSLLARMAPLQREDAAGGRRRWRLQWPFAGLARTPLRDYSELSFVLILLASTAYDGLHETEFWTRLYWVDLHALLQPWIGSQPLRAFPKLLKGYPYWQSAWLLLWPILYAAVYVLIIWLCRRSILASSRGSEFRIWALGLGASLLPIALVYHLAHYYTLLQIQGPKLLPLLSDPMGWGWDWLGTADRLHRQRVPDAGFIWHLQVALIVGGHMVGVWAAHEWAMQQLGRARSALLSQLPMLLLMMGLTVFGLWILSLPLQAGLPG